MKGIIKKILPSFLISWYHFLLAFLGAVIYGFPSKKIKVIGVTGTNGKTTVVYMTTKVLEEAGYRVASVSSIKFKIGHRERINTLKMTMPGRFKLQKFLRQAVSAGCQYAVLEVSSEGIKQHRHEFIGFSVAVFTNLTPEHIEAHGGFENYRDAKLKFFKAVKNVHIINIDDKSAEYFLKIPAAKVSTYGLDTGNINKRSANFHLALLGEFNIYNALAAISVGLSQNIPLETSQKAVEKIESVPGRMEIVVEDPFRVVVDYAVTPDALEGLYQTVKKEFSPSALICIFGACGGGRDKWKRPELGKIASNYCGKIILTNEDPYDENPLKIIEDIESGFSQNPKSKLQMPKYEMILDRREAIRKALELARAGDVVAISGKGSEPQMALARGKKIPWDDREVVREEFKKLKTIKPFEILPHRADLKIKVCGQDKKELFSNALLAMSESMRAEIEDEAAKREIEINSMDINALLVDFLSETLYLSQINKEAYFHINFLEFSDTKIKAELIGKKVKIFGEDIKAVTHHDLTIEEKDSRWEAIILFDI